MKYIRFSQLYKIPSSNGLSRPSAIRGTGFNMVGMGELFSNDILTDMKMDRVQMSEKEQNKYLLLANDLLFARQSLVAEGAGKCSIVKYFNEKTTFESHLIRVRLNENIANPWYYFYLFKLKSNPIKTIINQCAQAGIRGKELEKIKLPIPEISYQNKIVAILSKYDELIEVNNKRIKLLEQTAEKLYIEWFVHFRFPGYKNVETKKDKAIGWNLANKLEFSIPANWHFGTLDELAQFKRGKNITTSEAVEGVVPVISAGIEPSCFHNKPNVVGNSITVSGSGANAGYVSYHLIDIWAADCSYYQNEKNIWFVYSTLNFLRKVIDNMQVGAAQPHVYPKTLNKISIIVPDEKNIELFNSKVATIFDEIRNINQQNDNLINQRDLLLPRLMSGKLSVETKTGSVPKVKKIISFDEFCSALPMAARAKTISDKDLRAMYEAYIDDDATE